MWGTGELSRIRTRAASRVRDRAVAIVGARAVDSWPGKGSS